MGCVLALGSSLTTPFLNRVALYYRARLLNDDVLVSVRLPEEVVEAIDSLVRSGVAECRSDVLRFAILLKLRSMGYTIRSEELSKLLSKLEIR